MLEEIEKLVAKARRNRRANIFIFVLRIFLGFAFIPAGLKKLLGQPFTDPGNTGTFHEFLHAFHDTGLFYRSVGFIQLIAAVLLMTQYYSTIGALIMMPITAVIFVFCWSTMVVPTATVVTLMLLGVSLLLLWDLQIWKHVLQSASLQSKGGEVTPLAGDIKLWSLCGWAILVLYFGHTALTGEVYRPKGADWSNPSFILLQIITLMPILTLFIDSRRSREKAR